ncbi:response regulator [Massilia sp. DJPM01]|uniref:response regulator n=1 Tax=Massilia sp. DJPM01 TaxID=3024404 RepID=UPI00259FD96E|nr:response regulator [Massilia sp. DJPM01]
MEALRLAAEQAAQADAQRSAAARLAEEEAARQQAAAPVAPAAPAAPARVIEPKAAADTVVMIADDSKVVRVKTNRLLVNNQFQVAMAEDGLDAMKQIAERMPDVLITDVEMPGMNGFELTRHVRENPLTAHIPVIMISAEESYQTKAADAGVDVLLGKPYSDTVMIDHIQRFMRQGRG